ncbi:MAG: M48 family metallopeptidase [Pseudomonadales bacterium]|nr:M48 family metallopeptidase [Pseudomonadales bacterium]
MKLSYLRCALLLMLMLLKSYSSAAAEDLNLPVLGDATSSIVSLEEERELGQNFLRSLRAQAPRVRDPLLQDYLEHLIYRLASHSELQDRRLDLVVIDNNTINAFAAPGGIVGVNLGLFLYAETENEISAILAHEIAHLSQRHFARGLEASRGATLSNLAGMLAGIILVSVAGTDAGLAAITAGQGVAQSQMLRYSRTREAEADRVGIQTLAEAEMDPRAMAYMFERLERANRFNTSRIPEFLLTHPVTRDRIADTYNQTRQYPQKAYPLNLDYQLMKVRAEVFASDNLPTLIQQFEAGLNHADPVLKDASRYGLVLAHTLRGDADAAQRYLNPLKTAHPHKIAVTLAEAALHTKVERYENAEAILEQAVLLNPDNPPISMAYADVMIRSKQPAQAVEVLSRLVQKRPNDIEAWYLLAEAYGLANDIIGVHEARAEYFVLTGNLDQAVKQLGYAIPLARDDFTLNARLQTRIEEIHQMRIRDRKS